MFPYKCSIGIGLFLFVLIPDSLSVIRISSQEVSCTSIEGQCTMEEESRLQSASVDMLTRKHQDRVISIRYILNEQLQVFNEFFTKQLRVVHTDLDVMFSNTYGSFYQDNIHILNNFFYKIRGFSISFAESSMRTIIELFFDELFRVLFNITNPFYSLSEKEYVCIEQFYREIEAFDDIPRKIMNQLFLPLSNWKHFTTSLDTLQDILNGYLNITLKEECERGLKRMETCAKCANVDEKPCETYCVNIISGCTHQMLDSESAWKITIESIINLADQLHSQQNLVSALQPIPILISEAIMSFQEKRDYITNKIIGKCLLEKEDFGITLRRKRYSKLDSPTKMKSSRDHLILNQMFLTFKQKMKRLKVFFGDVPEQLCTKEDWASKNQNQCWNGTDVGSYNLPLVNNSQPFKNPEYQGNNYLTFRGSYIEERLRLHWLQSRISHTLNDRSFKTHNLKTGNHFLTKSEALKSEDVAKTDDEDYNDYDYEGSASYMSTGNLMRYNPYFRKDNYKTEIYIEPYPVQSSRCSQIVLSCICYVAVYMSF